MDVSTAVQLTPQPTSQPISIVKKRIQACGRSGCTHQAGGGATRLALIVSLVFLLRVVSPGVLAARTFGDHVSAEDVAVVAFESGRSVSPRMRTLRGSFKTENPQLHFGQFLGMFLLTSEDDIAHWLLDLERICYWSREFTHACRSWSTWNFLEDLRFRLLGPFATVISPQEQTPGKSLLQSSDGSVAHHCFS